MKKIVLTAKQADELQRAFKNMDYNLERFTLFHEYKKNTNKKWIEFKSLNDLSVEEIESALCKGYEIANEQFNAKKINYSKEEIEADIDYHLDHLLDAIKTENEKQIEYNKEKLSELTELLEELK